MGESPGLYLINWHAYFNRSGIVSLRLAIIGIPWLGTQIGLGGRPRPRWSAKQGRADRHRVASIDIEVSNRYELVKASSIELTVSYQQRLTE